jgi:thiol-disulfide isomerase/thioredoxin
VSTGFLPRWFAVAASVLVFSAGSRPAEAGDMMAPAFAVKTVDGKTLKLSDLRNKPVIVDFWATWCGPCRASMPDLNDMHARYGAKGLTVVGLSVDETGPAPVKRFASQLGVKFTIAMANDDILDAYGPIRSIPTTFFINRKGEIVRRVIGRIDSETMNNYVQEIMN